MPPKAEIEWMMAGLRVYDEGSYAEGSPHALYVSLTCDRDRVLIKGLRMDGERFNRGHLRAIERALYAAGFRIAVWERAKGIVRRSYPIKDERVHHDDSRRAQQQSRKYRLHAA
jgi:hypothetical protein